VGKVVRIVAHPASAITFEASERVSVHVTGSDRGDVMTGPVYAGAIFEGGAGHDRLVAQSSRRKDRHAFYGGAGNDTLIGGDGRDTLDGGPGDDVITAGDGAALVYGGPGNDVITAGSGGAEIHTGAGRNRVIAGGGCGQIHAGPGENSITGGPGGTTHVAWGGVTVMTGWRAGDMIRLVDWPGMPEVTCDGADVVIRLGLSFVVLQGVSDTGAVRRALA